ncbi:MAG: NAD(P)-dependent oxidoreductase [Rhodospirillaceae bacterium]|nr:NAD(P)-dependent oxidoreductase [Rhodospirillaceae bacterium]|tara:strand:+ start:8810 stop:9676 length:867 start_codon:yes stop_codon:yes gene_type:complete
MSHLFCFGFGFTAHRLAKKLRADGWSVSGTARTAEKCAVLRDAGFACQEFDGSSSLEDVSDLKNATHILLSAPPGEQGDPVLLRHRNDLAENGNLQWIGYLSATSVYGDTGGALVDEMAALKATTARGLRRIESEKAWLELGREHELPVHVFRLAGIYGPGRSAIDQLRSGKARRIIKEGHLFSRIHVDDIVNVLLASIAAPRPGGTYNVCDDEPAMSSDVMEYAAESLGLEPPPAIPFTSTSLSEMARSFYADNRLVDNSLIKSELGVTLTYPDFRVGLKAILAERG